MNMNLVIRLFLCIVLFASCTFKEDVGRIESDFNFDWTFCLKSLDSDLTKCPKDGTWRGVRLPHDWSIEEGYTQENTAGSTGYMPGGIGWYKKIFSLSSDQKDKQIAIHFEGVYDNSTVWINGHELGTVHNGYIGFEYDLTPYLKPTNELIVRVDRRAYANARWYTGSGIYRNVHLIAREKVNIPTNGVFVRPQLVGNKALIEVETEICNVENTSSSLTLEHIILKDGEPVANYKDDFEIDGDKTELNISKFELVNPSLWSLETPEVYQLVTFIKDGDRLLDNTTTRFGVRSIEFNAAKGFLLNGKSVKIKGVNLHHDMGCMGAALYDQVLYRRIIKLKEMGCNAIRTAHNPHSSSLLTMCDTLGMLVMDEFIDEWTQAKGKWITKRGKDDAPDSISIGYSAHFNECAERDLKSFMKRDRNSPSVILWSIGNEIEWCHPYYWAASKAKGVKGLGLTGSGDGDDELILKRFKELCGGKDELAETAGKLVKWVKDMDITRPVTSGVVIPSVSRLSGYTDVLDVVGYNYKDQYYEKDHKKYPNQPILGTENVGQYYEWAAVKDKEYIPGIFLWTGIDYLGENGPWPLKGALYSLFDFTTHKTARGHFFETLWKDTPKVYIVTTPSKDSEFKALSNGKFKSTWRKDPLRRWEWYNTFDKWKYADNEKIMVQVYSNTSQVELVLNGKSLGTKNRSDFDVENVMLWEVPYKAGNIVAIGKENGKEVARYSLATCGDVDKVLVKSDRVAVKSDGYDLVQLELTLMDKEGNVVVDKDEDITISLDKETKLLGIDNGSYTFVGDYKANTIKTHNGRVFLVLQPNMGAQGISEIIINTESGITKKINLKYTL